MELKEIYKKYQQSTGVTTDTRSIQQGNIYFALKGANFNGNTFALDAISKGAIAAVIDEEVDSDNPQLVLVDNVLETLQKLARHHRDQFSIPVLGLTGSNGKTTTKELIAAVLNEKFKVHYTKGNFNNHIGVPLTILEMPRDTEIAIIEMGANHVGEIHTLCQIANPSHGIITNIGRAHLEGFGGPEGVYIGKTELYRHIVKNKGVFFYNEEDSVLLALANGNKHSIGYSAPKLSKEAVALKFKYLEEIIQTQLFGNYNLANAAASIAIGAYFGLEANVLKQGLESYVPKNNRSQIVKKGNATIILDAYNANPSSMRKSIESFKALDGEKLAIIGSMKELGDFQNEEHQILIDFLESSTIEKVLLVGFEFEELHFSEKCSLYKDVSELIEAGVFENIVNDYDFILIKGSRSNKLETLVLDH